ncbi:MAG TPA: hypothetical protein VKS21_01360 [Spirochaetota bacterium]|nr:hypothetical protein [Spirochaetota bacterium]
MSDFNADTVKTAVSKAVEKTMADMAFIDTMPVSSNTDPAYKPIFYVNVLRPFSGAVALYFTYECKQEIVGNIFGAEFADVPGFRVDDCLLELLNVLAGNIMRNIYGSESIYQLDLPQVLFEEKEINFTGCEVIKQYFNAEGMLFMTKFIRKRQ